MPERTVFWKYRNQKVARRGEWKLLVEKDTSHLFNLELDLLEKEDLSESELSLTRELELELAAWEEDVMKGVKLKTN